MATQYDDRIEALTRIAETFDPPQRVKDEAYIKDYESVYAYSIRDPERYADVWGTVSGCYLTGDIAVCDEDGYFSVLGRSDDVLNVAGHRIGTADVENALVSHPAVAEAAAIGLPDEVKGEIIQVYVVLREGKIPSDGLRKTIIQHVRHELGPIATPSGVEFVGKLPKTRSGKIMRRLLRAEALGMEAGDISTLDD